VLAIAPHGIAELRILTAGLGTCRHEAPINAWRKIFTRRGSSVVHGRAITHRGERTHVRTAGRGEIRLRRSRGLVAIRDDGYRGGHFTVLVGGQAQGDARFGIALNQNDITKHQRVGFGLFPEAHAVIQKSLPLTEAFGWCADPVRVRIEILHAVQQMAEEIRGTVLPVHRLRLLQGVDDGDVRAASGPYRALLAQCGASQPSRHGGEAPRGCADCHSSDGSPGTRSEPRRRAAYLLERAHSRDERAKRRSRCASR